MTAADSRSSDRRRRLSRPVRRGAAVGALVGLVVFVAVPGIQPGAGATTDPLVGSQGVVTSLPPTASAVTVSGQGAYAGLRVTVNQTGNLVNQAVSVSWTGGTQTQSSTLFQSNYLQIFECWSDPEASVPGPSPSQCEFGAESLSGTSAPVSQAGYEYTRVLAASSWSTYGSTPGWKDPQTGFLIQPFEAVDGTTVNQQADYDWDQDPNNPKPFWLNSYFASGTTNEVDFARTYADGTGQQLFQVQTGLEAPGLGCGQQLADGATRTPDCWLVVVPRGNPAQENPSNVDAQSVLSSPLAPAAWANRITIPLQFNPVGTTCSVNADASQILGGELAQPAVASWQPALCSQAGSPSYTYIRNTDDQARQDIVAPTYGSSGMAVFSDPIPTSQVNQADPVVYAPITLSGVTVAFNIERFPALVNGEPDADEVPLAGDQVADLYLTPRLVAKLLTESYQAQFEAVTSSKPAGYGWVQDNPLDLFSDPDFLQWNPEFKLLSTAQAVDVSTLLVEESSSDAATAVWKWVLADPEAAAWLAGKPDPWGMVVNPLYSTSPARNPSGVSFSSGGLESFPKSDPYCEDTGDTVYGPPAEPARPLCILDWSPYSLSMAAAAASAGSANDGAKTTFNPADSPNTAWTANGPQAPGTHAIITITDTASAAQFGLQTASLSRAGDDSTDRTFVAPDQSGLTAGAGALVPSGVKGVLQSDPSTRAAGAYPLTMLTYAATTPETLSPAERQAYATFILYAIGDGQTQGVEPGDLPAGYLPLPGSLRLQALKATDAILNPPAAATTTSPTATTGASTSTPSVATSDTSSAALPETAGATGATGTASSPASGATTGSEPAGAPAAVTTFRTAAWLSGPIRWALPLLLLIGVGAALGALLLGRTRRDPAAGPDPATLGPDGGGS